jgi:DNA-binding response OmpR family regulator
MENSERILIVDDEQINLEFFEVMLSKLGFTVDTAVDGEDALERVLELQPDLIILDNIMPGMTGWEVTKTLKQEAEYAAVRETPIVMFSAMDDVQDKIEGFELGVEDYITKPFNFSEVLARIKAVLRHRDMSEEVRKREQRLKLVDSLNEALLTFAETVSERLSTIHAQAEAVDPANAEQVKAFLQAVLLETSGTQEELLDLRSRTSNLRVEQDTIKKNETSIDQLERRYHGRFEAVPSDPRDDQEGDT